MNYKKKMKLNQLFYKIFRAHTTYYVIFMLLFLYLYDMNKGENLTLIDLLDFTVITSFILAVVVAQVSLYISRSAKRKLEEYSKLTTDYDSLVGKYPMSDNLIEYKNIPDSNYRKGRRLTSSKKNVSNLDYYRFPITMEMENKGYTFQLEDQHEQYVLPPRISENYEMIMAAHNESNVYNQLTVRLDDYQVVDNTVHLYTSRTTYFDTLLTNRAMDYKWAENSSNRELFNPGPFLEALNESHFSNHLGFNGFIETADGEIIFVKRSKNLSIGKEALGASVSASLKTKYALDGEKNFTLAGLKNGIIKEISDELNIAASTFEFSLEKNIIALYRDIVEGGKPHLLFYAKTNMSSEVVNSNFKAMVKKARKGINVIDGEKLVFIEKDKLKKLYIAPDIVVDGKKAYRTLPYTAASIVMLINYLKLNH